MFSISLWCFVYFKLQAVCTVIIHYFSLFQICSVQVFQCSTIVGTMLQSMMWTSCNRPGWACLLQTRMGSASYRPVWGLPVTDQCWCWPVTYQDGACLLQTRVGSACYQPGWSLSDTDQGGTVFYRPGWGLPVTDHGVASTAVRPMLIFISIPYSYNCLGHTMGDG